jgi:hypothetical protein
LLLQVRNQLVDLHRSSKLVSLPAVPATRRLPRPPPGALAKVSLRHPCLLRKPAVCRRTGGCRWTDATSERGRARGDPAPPGVLADRQQHQEVATWQQRRRPPFRIPL